MGYYYDIFPVVNSIVEYFLNQAKLNKSGYLKYLKNILSFILVIFIFTMIGLFETFRTILQLILKCYYGKNYLGMLSGVDRTCLNPPSLFLNVYIIENKGDINELYENIKSACRKLYFSHKKFSSVMNTTLGYQYFISNQINFEDILTPISFNKDFITKEDLTNFIDEKYSNPILEKKLWEVIFINKPIIYNKKSLINRNFYVIIFKTTHTMSDAIYLSSMHQKYFFTKCDNKNFIKALKNIQMEKNKKVKNIIKYITIPIKFPIKVKDNKIKSKSISSLYLEENRIYFNMIKKIRKEYNVTFPQVIITAAMSSFSSYLKKKYSNLNKILYGATIRPENEDINEIIEGDNLINDLSFMISTFKCNEVKTIKEKLMDISRSLNNVKKSTDGQAMYILQQLGTFLPYPLLKFFFNILIRPITVGFTNIPGINEACINKYHLQDGFVYVNSYMNTKFIFQIYTYDERLQINLTATDNMVDTRTELDDVIKGVLENINELYEGLNV